MSGNDDMWTEEQLAALFAAASGAEPPADEEFLQRLREKSATAFAESPCVIDSAPAEIIRPAFPTHPLTNWRWIMRSPISRVTAAAIFVFAIAGVALWFHVSGTTPAFADFLQPILDAKTVRYKMTMETTGTPAGLAEMTGLSAERQKERINPHRFEVMQLGPDRTRLESEMPDKSKRVEILDGRQRKQLVLAPAVKVATLFDLSNGPNDKTRKKDDRGSASPRSDPGEPGPVSLFRALLLDTVHKPNTQRESLGEKEIDGRQVVGFRLSGHGNVVSVWGDPKTRLPVRIEVTMALVPSYKAIASDFEFNVPVDESLFSVDPPAGYKVSVRQSQPSDDSSDDSPEGEKDLIEMFRYYGQWSGGRFPDLLDMLWIDEVVSGAWRIDADLHHDKPQAQRDREENEAHRKVQRGMMFTVLLPKDSDRHYAGRGVSIGAAGTPVFWYRPKDAKKYRVIYADLSVQEADTPPRVHVVPVAQLENDLIEMFRRHSELGGGYFPDALDIQSVSRIVVRERQRQNSYGEPPQKPGAKEEQETAESLAKLQRGSIFVGLLPKQSDWHYAGKNVPLDMADRPIFWYRPEDSDKYRVVYADLSVHEADTPPPMPAALPEPGWPKGNCTIAGKVVAEATGKPVPKARVFLFYQPTGHGMFVDTDADGAFSFKNICTGPYSLQVINMPGYQDVQYDPEHKEHGWLQFSLKEGEQRGDIVLKAKEACRISGKVVDENGKVPEDAKQLLVTAWFKADGDERYASKYGEFDRSDCSYVIDGLSNKPAYVMVENQRAAKEGHAWPPIYYPGTFSRSEAKLITFDSGRSVENVNITRRKEGGLAIAGTVRDEVGKPVPEAFVVVYPCDMCGGLATDYTDAQGHYQIQGLGEGEFVVNVDAVHRGLVQTRTPIRLDSTTKKTELNFTLHRGVTISGKLVDENGRDWDITRHGFTVGSAVVGAGSGNKGFALTNVDFRNKYRPKSSDGMARGWLHFGSGDYSDGELIFPTKSTFIVQGMMPGHTTFRFEPQKVAKILHAGQNILDSGIDTEPGQEINDVTIVIGKQ